MQSPPPPDNDNSQNPACDRPNPPAWCVKPDLPIKSNISACLTLFAIYLILRKKIIRKLKLDDEYNKQHNNYKIMKKALSILRWFGAMIIAFLGYFLARFTFPLVYPFRNIYWVRWKKPFWYWFGDDDDMYGAEYWRKGKGITKRNWWVAYRWNALRNPMWNLHLQLKPIKGEEEVVSVKGQLKQNGRVLPIKDVASFQFENEKGEYEGNVGTFLSTKYSRMGKIFVWFKIKDKLYWRASYMGNIFWNVWMELQVGTGYRHTFRFKMMFNPKIK